MAALKLEHRLGIQAPAEAIWAVIADIERWAEWNPLYPRAAGVIRIGSPLELELKLEGQPPRMIRPVVLDWVPNEQLLWRLRMFGGLIRTTRYIEIERLADTGSIFSNGELFEGPMGGAVPKATRRAIRAGFAAMGEAVKARVEATWRAPAPAPI